MQNMKWTAMKILGVPVGCDGICFKFATVTPKRAFKRPFKIGKNVVMFCFVFSLTLCYRPIPTVDNRYVYLQITWIISHIARVHLLHIHQTLCSDVSK